MPGSESPTHRTYKISGAGHSAIASDKTNRAVRDPHDTRALSIASGLSL